MKVLWKNGRRSSVLRMRIEFPTMESFAQLTENYLVVDGGMLSGRVNLSPPKYHAQVGRSSALGLMAKGLGEAFTKLCVRLSTDPSHPQNIKSHTSQIVIRSTIGQRICAGLRLSKIITIGASIKPHSPARKTFLHSFEKKMFEKLGGFIGVEAPASPGIKKNCLTCSGSALRRSKALPIINHGNMSFNGLDDRKAHLAKIKGWLA